MRKRKFILLLLPLILILWTIGWTLFWTGNQQTNTQKQPSNIQVTVQLPQKQEITQ